MFNATTRIVCRLFLVGVAWLTATLPLVADDKSPLLSPETILAKQYVGKATIEFTVGKSGQLFEGRSIQVGESEALYLAPRVAGEKGSRVYVIVSWKVATRLRQLGIDDPSDHFAGKVVRVSGTVEQLSGGNIPESRILFWTREKYRSETLLSGTEPEYYVEVTSLDQLERVRKPKE